MKAVAGNFTNVHFRIFLLLLWYPLVAQAGDVDFSNYDVPLYTQIVDRIEAKTAPRLGDSPLTRERYFIIPFAYQDRGNHPEFSHSFIAVIRVFARKRLLDKGKIKYRADDRLYRKDKVAISCFHAMAGLDELYPNGGLFGTGFMMWGFNGTARVLIEYSEKASNKGLLLDPVDVKKDRFVFVYAPTAGGPVPYNPAKSASAYHR